MPFPLLAFTGPLCCYSPFSSLQTRISFLFILFKLFFWTCCAASLLAVKLVLWTARLTPFLPLPPRTPQWADLSNQHQTGKAGPPPSATAVSPVPRPPSPMCRSGCFWSECACEADQGGTAHRMPTSSGKGLGALGWPSWAMNANACTVLGRFMQSALK